MTMNFEREVEERLVRYVQIDTTADESSPTSPSTARQYDLLNLLVDELNEIGAQDVRLTEYGAVLATIPATVSDAVAHEVTTIALLAHVDTSPAYSGAGIKPIVHRHYQGGPILLPDDPEQVLTYENSPYLKDRIGDDIVTASGMTLLGADDKAGVAIIMAAAGYLLKHPEIPHGPIRIGFTPDEEIGRGVHADLPADLGAKFGYTLDGAHRGELVYETFSADRAVVRIQGVSIHPGWAKDKLVNALHLAAKIVDTMPQVTLTPETTEGRQGFIHLYAMSGTAAAAELHFILRDFEMAEMERQGALIQQVCATIAATEPRAHITCEVIPQYRNMRYWLENDMRPVDMAVKAYAAAGIEHYFYPIRGGTDGSRLTEKGVPTPNLFTGMQNIHGPLEWVSVQDMALAAEMCVQLAQMWAKATNG